MGEPIVGENVTEFGHSVPLSCDGNRVPIGCQDSFGQVQVFQRDKSLRAWNVIGEDQ